MKRHSWLLAAMLMATLLAACGKKSDDAETAAPFPTAATLGEQVVLTAAEYLASEPYASADRARGKNQAMICKACHSLDKGGPNMIGPGLYDFMGTKAGTRSGFEYSAVLRNADFVWTPEALDAWLAQPGRFMPGNRMTFAGVPDRQDRANLIAYLLDVTTTADAASE